MTGSRVIEHVRNHGENRHQQHSENSSAQKRAFVCPSGYDRSPTLIYTVKLCCGRETARCCCKIW